MFLLRHAHSLDQQPGHNDHDRYLSPQGMEQARTIGQYMQNNSFRPAAIFTSSAIRAHATSLIVAEQLQTPGKEVNVIAALYDATTRSFLQLLNSLPPGLSSALFVAHNPVITYLAEYLTKENIGHLNTAGLVVIDFENQGWAEVSEGTGRLVVYMHPDLINPS